jgi:hypothetical protein
MGAFLGGSTIAFAAGLAAQGVTEPVLHSYDLFRLGPFEEERYFPAGAPPGGNTRALYDANLAGYEHLLHIHEGDVLDIPWDGGELEILFVDIAKSYLTFDHLLTSYYPALVPGSLVVLQDYYWESGPWHHVVMELLDPYFAHVADEPCSALFTLVKAIPPEVLASCRWAEIPSERKLEAMARAIDKIEPGELRDRVVAAQEVLVSGSDMIWGHEYHDLG